MTGASSASLTSDATGAVASSELAPGSYRVRAEASGHLLRVPSPDLGAGANPPLVLVLVALTLVGIPVAMLGICLYAAGVYLAGIRIAALIGASLTTPEAGSLRDFGMALLLGLVVLAVGMNLPFLGILVRIAVVFVGLGLLVREASAAWHGRRAAA